MKGTYQIFYHDLDAPLNPPPLPSEYSSLHTLYPGRPMLRNDIFDRYYIPHCNPCEARRSFKEKRDDTILAARHLERLARKSAGGPNEKVTIHAVSDPSMPNEDPALAQLSTQSPIALNDGMEYPISKEGAIQSNHYHQPDQDVAYDLETFDGNMPMATTTSTPKREYFHAILPPDTNRGQLFYILVFTGLVVLILVFSGIIVGTRSKR